MGIFRRGRPAASRDEPADLATLLLEGDDMIEQTGHVHRSEWGLGSADRWDLDQETGRLTWTFPHLTASAPAQILGSFSADAGEWLWAWANPSVLPGMAEEAHSVRSWGLERGHAALTADRVAATEETAATLASIAFRIAEATGFYRSGGLFMTFGPVTLTASDGPQRTFTINLEG